MPSASYLVMDSLMQYPQYCDSFSSAVQLSNICFPSVLLALILFVTEWYPSPGSDDVYTERLLFKNTDPPGGHAGTSLKMGWVCGSCLLKSLLSLDGGILWPRKFKELLEDLPIRISLLWTACYQLNSFGFISNIFKKHSSLGDGAYFCLSINYYWVLKKESHILLSERKLAKGERVDIFMYSLVYMSQWETLVSQKASDGECWGVKSQAMGEECRRKMERMTPGIVGLLCILDKAIEVPTTEVFLLSLCEQLWVRNACVYCYQICLPTCGGWGRETGFW